uniref:Uncharacterized protein n=1 Tax=Anopheles christyi TaxID=43041 RepID=A0A182KC08_9DIPT
MLLLVSVALAAGEKKPEKRPTKKAHSLKPTKTPKSIIEEFTALPPADVDFIKELDRQFKEHGDKIRIKVERSNGTDGKNIKRTIDGDLGYGHYSNQADSGYHFSKPKYMIYPYSQHDIPPVRSTHSTHETVTDIEITPSHSYELKPIEEVYQVYPTQQYSQEHQQQQYYQHYPSAQQSKQLFQQEEEAPVIVLKIPGPSKYAAHLQALLQQYLEIRAAQLYKELEEQEYHQQQQYHHQQEQHHQHQLQQQHQQQQQHYVQEQEVHGHHHQQQQQQQQQELQHHEHHTKTKYSQPDPVYPTEISYVHMIRTNQNTYVPLPEQYYDAPKSPSPRPTKHRKTTVTPTHVTFHSTVQPEPAYHYQTYHPEQHAQVHEQQEQVHAPEHQQIQYQYVAQQPSGHTGGEHDTQYVYEKPMVNFVTPVPETPVHHTHEEAYHHHHQHQLPKKYPNFAEYHHHHMPPQQQEEEYLPEPKLVENYPSHKHTRVVYKSPSLKTELQQEALHHEHYHHQQQHQQQELAHHHQQQHQQQQQYILQEVYPSQASYFED